MLSGVSAAGIFQQPDLADQVAKRHGGAMDTNLLRRETWDAESDTSPGTDAPTSGSQPRGTGASAWRSTWLGPAAVVAAFLLRVLWASTLPFNDGPDEFVHQAILLRLRATGRPTTMADVPDRVPTSLAALPPLGYLPGLITSLAVDPGHPAIHYWSRLGNILLGTLATLMGWRAARRLLPGAPGLAAAVAWGLALHPQLAFTDAYVNNDSSGLLGAMTLWWLSARPNAGGSVEPADADRSRRSWIAIGVVAGLTMLAKLPAAGVALALVPEAVGLVRRRGARGLAGPALVLLFAGLTVLPWIVWSLSRGQGWFGLEVHRAWWLEWQRRDPAFPGTVRFENARYFALESARSFLAVFGYGVIQVPRYLHLICGGLALAGMLFVIIERALPANAAEPSRRLPLAAIALGALGPLLFLLVHGLTVSAAPQGRYLLPAAWGLHLIVVVGMNALGRRVGLPSLAWLWLAALVWTQLESLAAVRAATAFPQREPRVSSRLLAKGAALPGQRGEGVPALFTGTGAEVSPAADSYRYRVASGRPEPIHTAWTPARGTRSLALELDRAAGPLEGAWVGVEKEGVPGVRPIPFDYPPGGVIRLTIDLGPDLPTDPSARYRLRLELADGPCDLLIRRLAPLDRAGRPITDR